jgi:hypothetical protein
LLEALKPPPFKGDSTALISTASTNVIVSGIIDNSTNKDEISADPYKLNKLNIRKPGFIKDREMIIEYKFKYFKKSDKKG